MVREGERERGEGERGRGRVREGGAEKEGVRERRKEGETGGG